MAGALYVDGNINVGPLSTSETGTRDDSREDAAYDRLLDAEKRLNRILRRFDSERKVLGYLWMDDLRDIERDVARCVSEFDHIVRSASQW